MTAVPRAALIIGLAGLLPFLWGTLSALLPALARPVTNLTSQRFAGTELLVDYGVIILCFMSGALWGFAARGGSTLAHALSVLPALWVLFFIGDTPQQGLRTLLGGFVGTLLLDAYFWLRRYAPGWWMALRLVLTSVVVPCLVLGLYYG